MSYDLVRRGCKLPDENDHPKGTVIRCADCGRRYTLRHRGFVGDYTWIRRYWPWPR